MHNNVCDTTIQFRVRHLCAAMLFLLTINVWYMHTKIADSTPWRSRDSKAGSSLADVATEYLPSLPKIYTNNDNNENAGLGSGSAFKSLIQMAQDGLNEVKQDAFDALGIESSQDHIIGDVSSYLDFAVVGFPKCGTSTMMHYLNTAESWVPDVEMCQLNTHKNKLKLIQKLKEHGESNPNQKRGIKCPASAESALSHKHYRKYFPKTNFITGVRHPVEWFESFYNFRINNVKLQKGDFPRPNELIGQSCGKTRPHPPLCTHRARFGFFLSFFGKTPMNTDVELDLLDQTGGFARKFAMKQAKIGAANGTKVFLYNMDQLADQNSTRTEQFREDLRGFIGLKDPLPPVLHHTPGKKHEEEEQAKRNALKINICEKQYEKLREVLVKEGANAAKWILEYFVESDEVVVSDLAFFAEGLNKW
eukprot:CAMPEP_0196816242 /NCGR_PEP_ID=MMETSP1362-20130617/54270_1 /TAXON_ID=163516 /ORGANISM="Leptocylindrus danicus, Strain CCMP1856" /LENGTH=419 /DNA_ID=CAMNT_0042193493 /DNA_START=64 /DNA_END=1320 /DNA_ORIENTATION=-